MDKCEQAQHCLDNPCKPPWVKWYPSDWFGSAKVSAMTAAERGVYASLLFAEWDDPTCSLPVDPIELAEVSRVDEQMFNKCWTRVQRSFFQHNSRYFNQKLIELRMDAQEKLQKLSEAGKKSAAKRCKIKRKNICSTNVQHSGSSSGSNSSSKSSKEGECEGEKKQDELTTAFEEARKLYPGTKRGFEPEYSNLRKKHKDWKKIIPLLKPAIEQQIKDRESAPSDCFIPSWKNFSTWINNQCWTEELNFKTRPTVWDKLAKQEAEEAAQLATNNPE